jgi:hypothetical protein
MEMIMKVNKDFVMREIAGDYILVPTGETALIFNGLISVNETAAFLWEQLKDDVTEDDLVEALFSEFDVDKEIARKDADDFIGQLREMSILED